MRMKISQKSRFPNFLIAILLLSIPTRGDDLTTKSGKVFQNIEITDLDCDSITVSHKGGVTKIALQDLAPEIQKRFSPAELFKALRQKTAELDELRGRVASRQDKPETLGGKSAGTAALGPIGSELSKDASAKLVPDLAGLPPLRETDVVAAEELAQYFKTDPRIAEARFKKKTFRIHGKVERFEERPFVRKVAVVFETSVRSAQIVCELQFPDEFSAVYGAKDGRVLVGIGKGRNQVRLMEVGDFVTMKGKCEGLHGVSVIISHCEKSE